MKMFNFSLFSSYRAGLENKYFPFFNCPLNILWFFEMLLYFFCIRKKHIYLLMGEWQLVFEPIRESNFFHNVFCKGIYFFLGMFLNRFYVFCSLINDISRGGDFALY